ncbi:PVC-type heme-binding CxxCH protein, partial [Persicitalea sp.]|uniref:PVC-type heme-binding CxxCH protein n=1 Tax=Persicitalea sp. TaxID=3100273 RepID=UPI0035932A87
MLAVGLVAKSGQPKTDLPASVPPDQALATFQIADGFQIEMIASEPLVADPVAMEIDEAGRMYVVEMHGYPMDKSGSGKIKLLSDKNGDGKMDESTVFAEGLVLPTGILRWKNGVIVTDAPNVLYLEDADGDGKAEIRDTLLTGFALSNPQHNLNNPILGLDNWIYFGHESAITTQTFKEEFGDRGGDVHYPHRPNSPRLPENAQGRGVRLRPDRAGLEMLSGKTQFGHSFDRWGRYLVVGNANHAMHEVMAARYINRNPALLLSDAVQSISNHGNAAEVFPITKNPLDQLLTDVGVFTSACATTAYQGGLFPAPFDRVAFVAEPVSNLIHADMLNDKGATFTASRLYENKEFLASTDAWFRPVNMFTGPDGAIYVVDYYRQIIEHPEWMADDVIKSGALYNGTDKGRIYRITPKGTPKATWAKDLKAKPLSNAQLVQKLADPNIWWRRNAQRMLIDRQATAETDALTNMATTHESPLGRLHALWTLEGLDKLQPELLFAALKDRSSGIRENAIRLAEPFIQNPQIQTQLLTMTDDTDPKVRFQLLCTLGFLDSQEGAKARENVLFKDLGDKWVQIAALSAQSSAQSDLLSRVLSRYEKDQPAYGDLIARLSTMTGYGGSAAEIESAIEKSLQPSGEKNAGWQSDVLQGLAQGLKRNPNAKTSLQGMQEKLMNA